MTPPHDSDAELEALLRRGTPGIPDNGFSSRVMAALPAPSAPAAHVRTWWLIGGTAAGVALAALMLPSRSGLKHASARLQAVGDSIASLSANPAIALAYVIAALCILIACSQRTRRTLRLN